MRRSEWIYYGDGGETKSIQSCHVSRQLRDSRTGTDFVIPLNDDAPLCAARSVTMNEQGHCHDENDLTRTKTLSASIQHA